MPMQSHFSSIMNEWVLSPLPLKWFAMRGWHSQAPDNISRMNISINTQKQWEQVYRYRQRSTRNFQETNDNSISTVCFTASCLLRRRCVCLRHDIRQYSTTDSWFEIYVEQHGVATEEQDNEWFPQQQDASTREWTDTFPNVGGCTGNEGKWMQNDRRQNRQWEDRSTIHGWAVHKGVTSLSSWCFISFQTMPLRMIRQTSRQTYTFSFSRFRFFLRHYIATLPPDITINIALPFLRHYWFLSLLRHFILPLPFCRNRQNKMVSHNMRQKINVEWNKIAHSQGLSRKGILTNTTATIHRHNREYL